MSYNKILVVGGTFDENEGKSSGLINKLFKDVKDITFINGGNLDFIRNFLDKNIYNYEIILWFANISNDVEKFNDIKKRNPRVILVESKRNDNNKYSDKELVWHMLKNKANLMLEFSKQESVFRMRLLDPLGNEWLNTTDSSIVADIVFRRAIFLSQVSRQKTLNVLDTNIDIPNNEAFFEIIRKNAETFSDLINPADEANKRFLGNASFRCESGFPSFRDINNENLIFVSKRNVNKETIGKDGFVPVIENSKGIQLFSEFKASVDTPVQVKLYRKYKHINYMLHAHVYINGGFITENNIPCGGLEEVDEIVNCIERNYENLEDNFYINLKGHGSIILAKDLDAFRNLEYIKRPIPEKVDFNKNELIKYVHIPF